MLVRREMRACRKAAQNEICRICSEKAHGFHFGVLTCRACSAFFRRTVALNMQYHCRFQNNCQIDKYPQSNEIELELFNRINLILDDAIQNPRTSPKLSTLEMFRLGMNHLRKRRTVVHQEKFIDIEPFFGKEEFMDVIRRNWEMVTTMSGREIELYGELLAFVKPFVDLAPDQRWILFKQFAMSFMRFERTYETYRIQGEEFDDSGDSEISFNGEKTNFISALLRENEPLKGKIQRQSIISIFGPGKNIVQRGLLNPMIEIKLSEIEFATLSLHLLWLNPCSDGINKETEKISNHWRRQAFKDLHDYYTNSLFMSNYAVRLGDFMALMTMLEKIVSFKKENFFIADLFSLAKIHPSLYSLFR